MIGVVHFFQGGAGVAFLSAGLATGLFPQTLGLGLISEVAFVGGRRLAAGAAVALEVGKTGLELLNVRHAVPQLKKHIRNGLGISLGQGDESFSGGTLHGDSYGEQVLNLS